VVQRAASEGTTLYPEFCAVTWASDHNGLGHWVDACCNNATSLDNAICDILPSTVGLDKGDADGVAVIQHTWMNLYDESVVQMTYDYVFDKFKDKFFDFENFKATCVPDKAVFANLSRNGPRENEHGLKAYERIFDNDVFRAQMLAVGCNNPAVSDFVGACRCQSNVECDWAVAHFCGPDYLNTLKCDPSPYICPSDGTLPVGYVRAYLEYFLDAVPAFRGTGYGEDDGKDGEPEYIISPNIPKKERGVQVTPEVQCVP
jgi:hypothetical protein